MQVHTSTQFNNKKEKVWKRDKWNNLISLFFINYKKIKKTVLYYIRVQNIS